MFTIVDIGKRVILKKYKDCTSDELSTAGITEEEAAVAPESTVNFSIEIPLDEKLLILEEWNSTIDGSIRTTKIKQIRDLKEKRMGDVSPGLNSEVYKLYKFCENRFVPGTENAKQEKCKAIYDYAKSKIDFCRTATLEEVEAYDPLTDVNFPT